MAPLDGICWGEQTPDADEEPVTWQRWQTAADTPVTVQNDQNWGQAEIAVGTPAVSPVTDTGDTANKTFTVTRDKYGLLGSGTVTLSIRGAATSFEPHDGSPSWATYTAPTLQAWRYVQVRIEAT